MKTKVAPHGWQDLGLQLGLLSGCYLGYQLVRGIVDQSVGQAFWHATQIIGAEQALGVFIEPSLQAWARGQEALMGIANWMYLNSHYLVSGGALFWIYHRHRECFSLVRNSFLIAMVLALVGYALFPTAPPRMMPEWGFHDTVAQATGISANQQQGSALINMYAAVPSMHVCFALLVGWWMSRLVKRQWARIAWLVYPIMVIWVVVVTGNHYLVDALLGALVALVSATLAKGIRPRSSRTTVSI